MKEFIVESKLMGSAFELCVVDENDKRARELLQLGIDEIRRIENLLSEFLPGSETSKINQNAGKVTIAIDTECFDLIERCQAISKLTGGNFDITTSNLKKLYSFKSDQFQMPLNEVVKKTLKSVGYEKLILIKEQKSIHFTNKNTTISFAAIGKGYASDKVKKIWMKEGVRSGYINASGDLNAFGKKTDGSQWKIGISNPENPSKKLFYVPVDNASVATSGDYQQFFINNGVRYSHNINPHTGLPLTGIKSVSIFSPSAELSDALATAVYVMGSKDGIGFVNHLPKTHAIIIDDKNDVFFSKYLHYEQAKV
jgi:thiamine biosynthesis lipoprotein